MDQQRDAQLFNGLLDFQQLGFVEIELLSNIRMGMAQVRRTYEMGFISTSRVFLRATSDLFSTKSSKVIGIRLAAGWQLSYLLLEIADEV